VAHQATMVLLGAAAEAYSPAGLDHWIGWCLDGRIWAPTMVPHVSGRRPRATDPSPELQKQQ
jgi:hypothetical protein